MTVLVVAEAPKIHSPRPGIDEQGDTATASMVVTSLRKILEVTPACSQTLEKTTKSGSPVLKLGGSFMLAITNPHVDERYRLIWSRPQRRQKCESAPNPA
jgi:hypothetical protein